VSLRKTDAEGRAVAAVEGAALLLRPASGVQGGWSGELAGPAKVSLAGLEALSGGQAPVRGAGLAGEAVLETPGTLRFEFYPRQAPGEESRRLFVSTAETAVLTIPVADAKSGAAGKARLQSDRAQARLRWDGAGAGQAWIVQEGSVDARVWDERGRRDGPEWSLAAARMDTQVSWSKAGAEAGAGTRAVLEGIEAAGPVRFVNFGEGGIEEAWGTGKSLRLESRPGEDGTSGTLEGPFEFFFLAEGGYPPLEAGRRPAGNLKWGRLQGEGPLFFRAEGALAGAAPLKAWTDRPATLLLEAAQGKEKSPLHVRVESEGLAVAASREAGAGAWALPEVQGKGETRVVETAEGMIVTATGRDFAYVPTAGEGRFRGEGVKVKVEGAK
jgi:hypothetical protein